ncbi:hypothetical protein OEZ86_000655 [Tetradesmus obliquus]|nr:hypothetical protein OEZ86_000655 [Tetradesmus obliquus]
MDPRSGFAPPDVQQNGLGEVLLARTDGKDYTVTELWQLHEYNCHLMNRWGDWLEDGMDSPDVQAELQEALSPQGFADHTQMRADLDEEEDEDDDDDAEDKEEGGGES